MCVCVRDNHFLSDRTVCFECGLDRDAGHHSIILVMAESLYVVLCPDSASVPLCFFSFVTPSFCFQGSRRPQASWLAGACSPFIATSSKTKLAPRILLCIVIEGGLGICCESSSSFMWVVKSVTEERKENH